MQRVAIAPRPEWEQIVQSQGLSFYREDDTPYWDESACYAFSLTEIDRLEDATRQLHRMCLEAVDHVIRHRLFDEFLIPPQFADFVTDSWQAKEPSLYGRFDFAFDGENVKLLEYNADTPTGLIEAAAIQWFWLQDIARGDASIDQFNSIHEHLIEGWVAARAKFSGTMYFSSLPDYSEDYMTAHYLRDTAIQAGHVTDYIEIQDIGWDISRREFVDLNGRPIANMFKLYPWEWLLREKFGEYLLQSQVRWLEPPWKMILSNKALLTLLPQLFPDCPYLLRADREPFGESYVRKPILGREGANTTLVIDGETVAEVDGRYGAPFVYQEYAPLPEFDGYYPVIGSWVVNGHACGMGIREDSTRITSDISRFVPHLIRD